MEHCRFVHGPLTECRFHKTLTNCYFDVVPLTNCIFFNTTLIKCRFSCDSDNQKDLTKCTFESGVLTECSFEYRTLTECYFGGN